MNKNFSVISIVLLVIGAIGGYWYGSSKTYDKGYQAAVADVKAQQGESAKKASEEAPKTANPFQVSNPLEGVEANPFDKAKDALNPFAK